jgi:MFS family permease
LRGAKKIVFRIRALRTVKTPRFGRAGGQWQSLQYKWTALTVTTTGVLMAGIAGRLLVVGLPTIGVQLQAGAAELVWITQAFNMASIGSELLAGRITDIFGRVKLYEYGFLTFTVGSILSVFAFNAYELMGFRIIQGVGAGIVYVNSSAIITDASPKGELGFMLGINQTARRVGNVAGLTLAGVVLSVIDWRGLFYVIIPFGVFGTIWAHLRLKEIAVKDVSRSVDWPGFVLITTGLTLLLLAITFVSYGAAGLTLEISIAFALAGVILIAAFVKLETGSPSPLLDTKLFKIRSFAVGNIAQLLNALAFNGVILLVAFYLQLGLGYSPLQAGLGLVPLDAVYLVSSFVCGRLSDIYAARTLTILGLVLNTLSFLAMSTFGANTPYGEIALVLIVLGVGNGMFTPPNLKTIMSSVPSNRIGIASAFRELIFSTGATVSYGLVILFLTFGISYPALSQLIQGTASQLGLSLVKNEFFVGFSITAFLMAVIDTAAIVVVAGKGKLSGQKSQPVTAH